MVRALNDLALAMGPINIGIEAGLACSARPTGVQRFAQSILDELLRLDSPDIAWHLYVPPGGQLPFALPAGAQVRSRVFASKRWAIHQTWADRLHVLYTPGHNLPRGCRGSIVPTIHDLIFDEYPDSYPPERVPRFRKDVARVCRRAARIVTPSQATRRELAARYEYPLERIDVIGEGCAPVFSTGTARPLPERLVEAGLTTPFFLAIGRLNRRKNLVRAVEAYRLLLRRGDRAALVIVGRDDYGAEELKRALATDRVPGERIVLLGYVSDEEASALYHAATALVYVSLAEGFGLPILEAMGSGAAVIASNVSSLPEVAGDAALLVDPLDVRAICDAMHQVLTDSSTARKLVQAGRARAAQFSWRISAERLRAALLSAASSSVTTTAGGVLTPRGAA